MSVEEAVDLEKARGTVRDDFFGETRQINSCGRWSEVGLDIGGTGA